MLSAHSATSAFLADIKTEFLQRNLDNVYVGFSGGVDSALLLRVTVDVLGPDKVTAIHVNHGLSEQADAWQRHCAAFAEMLGCHFLAAKGAVENAGHGVEAAARSLRYSLFEKYMSGDATLLLGHHLDDQVETFFLRLLRGAGIHGLQAMSKIEQRPGYRLYRPLLDLPRQQIETFAADFGLTWIDDDSNTNQQFDRNFLRHSVLPLIETRWPAYRDRVHATIELLGQQNERQQSDMSAELAHRLSHDGALKLVQLDKFSDDQKLTLLYSWLRSIGQQVPSKTRLQTILSDVVSASADAAPAVTLGNGSVRRHGPALYWVADCPDPDRPPEMVINEVVDWQGVGQVAVMSVESTDEAGPLLRNDLPDLHWRLRSGGETLRPYGRSKQRDLKRLLQEYRVKPWLRYRMPLLYSGHTLVAAGDELVSADHLAAEGQSGLKVIWRKT